jgi:hypothetical protein
VKTPLELLEDDYDAADAAWRVAARRARKVIRLSERALRMNRATEDPALPTEAHALVLLAINVPALVQLINDLVSERDRLKVIRAAKAKALNAHDGL